VLTPDSSRFWLASEYRPGGPQPSLDKQPVRDWLAAHWREGEPAPELPPDVVAATTERYLQAYRMLTGEELSW
jgi:phosphoribosylaminoimidazole-succinocarboxamide synthase